MITFGFYNAINHDRAYDTVQISNIFDGILTDGIFENIGTAMVVTADTDLNINVGIGRAWFNHTWTLNDAILPLTADPSELVLNRIDAVVLEVNADETVRANDIKIIKGIPSSEPLRPVLADTLVHHQHPLAYIYRGAGTTVINQADITNMVGSDDTPFVTGILQTISLNSLLGQWENELDLFVSMKEVSFTEWSDDEKAIELAWIVDQQTAFITWFNNIKDQLGVDAAGNLQNQINKAEIEKILITGLLDGQKTFSDDGSVISTTDSTGRTLVKTFTNGFLTITSVLKGSSGSILATMIKTFSADGHTVDTTVTIN